MQKALEVVDGGSMTYPHRSLLISGGRIVDPANAFDDVADLLIEEGTGKKISKSFKQLGGNGPSKRVETLGFGSYPGLFTEVFICGSTYKCESI